MSQRTFLKLIRQIKENIASAAPGVFGSNPDIGGRGGAIGNDDFYARGDARIPMGTKKIRRRKK